MVIKIVQICDGCEKERYLRVSSTGRNQDIFEASQDGGWSHVGANLHLCPSCIKNAVKK